jgi:hypothetical protein
MKQGTHYDHLLAEEDLDKETRAMILKRIRLDEEEAAKEKAAETGTTIGDILIAIIYDFNNRNQLAAIKLYHDLIRPMGQTDTAVVAGPGIFLPEAKPDPAKVIPMVRA